MNLSRDEAAQALREIDVARSRTLTMRNYRHFAPFLMLWGVIWLLANATSDIYPAYGGHAWLAGIALGGAGSFWLGMRAGKREGEAGNRDGWRWGLSFAVLLGYFTAVLAVLPGRSGAQSNAFISLFWAFAYMAIGAWVGWRIFAIGLAVAALTLIGYFTLTAHFALWMGVVAGGALIAGGLWLRKA